MINLRSASPWCLLSAFLLCASDGVAPAQQTSDAISVAQSLVAAVFPELMSDKTHRVVVSLDPPQIKLPWNDPRHVLLTILKNGTEGSGTTELKAELWWTPKAGLESVTFSGDYVKTESYRTLVRRIESHPEWTDDDIAVEAFSAGAEFLPSRITPAAIEERVKPLGSAIGAIKRAAPRFVWKVYGTVGVVWIVDLETSSTPATCYTVELEPFGGRLTSLHKREDCKFRRITDRRLKIAD